MSPGFFLAYILCVVCFHFTHQAFVIHHPSCVPKLQAWPVNELGLSAWGGDPLSISATAPPSVQMPRSVVSDFQLPTEEWILTNKDIPSMIEFPFLTLTFLLVGIDSSMANLR